ncbi:hypothetical protein M885DRAFT_235566 [Pelagophyceae sp. CCMP2097]|nr:hypothetical protein M885DRAFT_235566 [Pelagophyceae sp. CCMP2097]
MAGAARAAGAAAAAARGDGAPHARPGPVRSDGGVARRPLRGRRRGRARVARQRVAVSSFSLNCAPRAMGDICGRLVRVADRTGCVPESYLGPMEAAAPPPREASPPPREAAPPRAVQTFVVSDAVMSADRGVQDPISVSLGGKFHGQLVARLSSRTMLIKEWKGCFFVFEGPRSLLIFRDKEDYSQFMLNPYIDGPIREALIKRRITVAPSLDIGP